MMDKKALSNLFWRLSQFWGAVLPERLSPIHLTGHERPSSVETELMVVRERASCEFSEKVGQVCSLEKASLGNGRHV